MNETRREKRKRVSDTLASIDNEEAVYCWKCINEGSTLTMSSMCSDHKQGYTARFCETEQSHRCHLGSNCRSCHGAKHGFGNPEVHKKTIESQIENGTFNMLDPEVQKNKTSNSNLTGGIKSKECAECDKDTFHIGNRCLTCSPMDTGIRETMCVHCDEITYHNGRVCMKCDPTAHSGYANKYCEVCSTNTSHNSGVCVPCNPAAGGYSRSLCIECNDITFQVAGRCYVCDPWNNGGFVNSHCSTCDSMSLHIGHRCYSCDPWDTGGFKVSFCTQCNKETNHNGSRCSACDPWEGSFNRETFYASKLIGVKFNSINRPISIPEIDTLSKVPGVWSKELIDGTVLDVAQTQDIGNEMFFSLRALSKGKSNIGQPDSYFEGKPYLYKKYRDMALNDNIVFKLIAIDIETKEERERIEAKYAHTTKAMYWSPAPGQLRLVIS